MRRSARWGEGPGLHRAQAGGLLPRVPRKRLLGQHCHTGRNELANHIRSALPESKTTAEGQGLAHTVEVGQRGVKLVLAEASCPFQLAVMPMFTV